MTILKRLDIKSVGSWKRQASVGQNAATMELWNGASGLVNGQDCARRFQHSVVLWVVSGKTAGADHL